jgi:hypothetical protein
MYSFLFGDIYILFDLVVGLQIRMTIFALVAARLIDFQ